MTVFIAFYSYKGGVGRSMALANVGWILAARGKRVVLVDMDLEAPSLPGLVDLAPPPDAPTPSGIVELAEAYSREGRLPALEGHYYSVPGIGGRGALWVMPAGRLDKSYQETLAGLNWSELHPTQGTHGFAGAFRTSLAETLRPHYVLIDSRTGFSDVGGLTTHLLADQVVLIFNLTRGCMDGTVRAYRSMTEREQPPHVVLVASPVPPFATEEGTIIERRLKSARDLMPLGLRYGQDVIRIEYDPRLVLGDQLAVTAGGDLPAAARYRLLAETLIQANVDEVIPYVERAKKLQREGSVRDALTELRSFVDAHPNEADGYLELGRLLLASGQNKDAREVFQRAITFDETTPWAYRGLGEALAALDDAVGAIEALRRAESLGDKGAEVYQALAAALEATSDLSGAEAARRRGMIALLDQLATVADPGIDESLSELRDRFLSNLARNPPYPGFVAGRFWQRMMGSLMLRGKEKRSVAQAVQQGLPADQLRGLVRIFDEEVAQVRRALGPEADELQDRVALAAPDTRSEVLALQRNDKVDALVLLYAATCEPGAPDLDILRRAVIVDPDRYAVRYKLADALTDVDGPDQLERFRESLTHWRCAVDLAPQDEKHGALFNWGWTLVQVANTTEDEEGARLLREACEHFERAAILKPDMYEAWYNWGSALVGLAEKAEGEEGARLLHDACENFKRATILKPDMHEAWYNWGSALGDLAGRAEGEEHARLLREACERYERAVAIKPDMDRVLILWGLTLAQLAETAEGEDRAHMLREACKRYERAVAVRPDKHQALMFWGNALVKLTKTAEGEERMRLLREACGCYERAVAIKPDQYEVLDNWATALLYGAGAAGDAETVRAYAAEAAQKARAANALEPSSGDYNLACALSRLGDFDASLALVDVVVERRPDMCSQALADPDLAPLWAARPDARARLSAAT